MASNLFEIASEGIIRMKGNSYWDYKIENQRFLVKQGCIGQGSYGIVYRAYRYDPSIFPPKQIGKAAALAIKVQSLQKKGKTKEQVFQKLQEEALQQNKMFPTTIYRVNDYALTVMPDLGEPIIRNNRQNEKIAQLTLSQRFELAVLIVQTYFEFYSNRSRLYDDREGLTHTDIKPANLLVKIRYSAKDPQHLHPIFIVNPIDFTTTDVVTPRTLAPECLHGFKIRRPIDHAREMAIYSLGFILTPLLNEGDPHFLSSDSETKVLSCMLNAMDLFLEENAKKLGVQKEMSEVIQAVHSMCAKNPALRPTFVEIIEVLNRARIACLRREYNLSNDESQPSEEVNVDSVTSLVACVKLGGYETAKNLLSGNNIQINIVHVQQCDSDGRTLLHLAILGNHTKMVRLLLDKGANPNKTDLDNRTPLNCALVMQCDTELITLLIDRGADIHQSDNHGKTPLQLAISHNCDLAVIKKLLLKQTMVLSLSNFELMHCAALSGSNEVAQYIEENWIDGNGLNNEENFRLLKSAINLNHVNMVEFLLHQNVNINTKDSEGLTLLHYAATIGNSEMIERLLLNGADINAQDFQGNTALHYAVWCRNYNYNAVKLLLDRGVNITLKNSEGLTAYSYVFYDNVENKVAILEPLFESRNGWLAGERTLAESLNPQGRGSSTFFAFDPEPVKQKISGNLENTGPKP